jgi:UvrD/REP helicase N-terminal domain
MPEIASPNSNTNRDSTSQSLPWFSSILARWRRWKPADKSRAACLTMQIVVHLYGGAQQRACLSSSPLIVFPAKAIFDDPVNDSGSPLTMTIPYSENLNPKQRHAVEHGGSALAEAGPLLIIAGAGSGKTNTLAHRVAHLIVWRRSASGHATDLLTTRCRGDDSTC